MSAISLGPRKIEMTRDAEGHRTYKVTFGVQSTIFDGPFNVLNAAGLPIMGEVYEFNLDLDLWAWCHPDASVKPLNDQVSPCTQWEVEMTFSTRPPPHWAQRCQDTAITDPLLEPPKLSGNFMRRQEEAVFDRFGKRIANSAFEPIRGPLNEWEISDQQVEIEMNFPFLDLGWLDEFVDHVNDSPLWGLPARCWKLSEPKWDRRYYGSCEIYYTVRLSFAGRKIGWDRDFLDEGTKALNGHLDPVSGIWVLDNINGAAPDPNNPTHFIRFKDVTGENVRVILNGKGVPAIAEAGYTVTGIDYPNPGEANIIITETPSPVINIGDTIRLEDINPAVWNGVYKVVDKLDASNIIVEYDHDDPAYISGGKMFTTDKNTGPGSIHVEKYNEVDFLQLGIPSSIP